MKNLILIMTLVLGSTMAQAQSGKAYFKGRKKLQRARIRQGNQSGEINRKERSALRKSNRHIRRYAKRAQADGEVTRREKRKLNRKLNKRSKMIYRTKHNES